MSPRARLSPTIVALTCSLTLAVPATAAAGDGDPHDDLSERASEHVTKAIRLFNSRDYGNAEAEFKRAAFFAPKWRPLHFNMAVLAEAQGKLGTAIAEYKQFKPYATPDEGLVVDQRLHELDDRRKRIAGTYKKQIGLGAGFLVVGLGGVGVGALFTALYIQETDPSQKTSRLAGATIGYTAGFVIVAYAATMLARAVKSKRQLDGLALGPTRLKWNGGAGATLSF